MTDTAFVDGSRQAIMTEIVCGTRLTDRGCATSLRSRRQSVAPGVSPGITNPIRISKPAKRATERFNDSVARFAGLDSPGT